MLDKTPRSLCRTAFTVGCSAKALEAPSSIRYRSSVMVMASELSAILGLQMRTTLVFVGMAIDWPEDLTNHGPAPRLQAPRIAAFVNVETTPLPAPPFLRLKYLPINLPLQ